MFECLVGNGGAGILLDTLNVRKIFGIVGVSGVGGELCAGD